MAKSFFYGMLTAFIIGGIAFFGYGRINTSDLQRAIDRTNKDLEGVKSALSQFGNKFDSYSGSMAELTQRSTGLWDQAESLRKEAGDHVSQFEVIQSGLLSLTDKINSVEKSVRRSVVVSKDFADVLHEYRRRGKIDAAKN